MSTATHVLVLALSLFSVLFILRLVRRRQLRAKYSLLWLSAGVVLVALAASPQLLDRVSVALGIYYGPTTFFLAAIVLLFLIAIHFSWELSRLEERSRVLAEVVAVLRAELAEASRGDSLGSDGQEP
jgi:hypothetical protein